MFTSQWRAQLHKSADVIFEIPPTTEFWSREMHEPIVVGLYFPSLEYKPWFVKGTLWSLKIQNELRERFKAAHDSVEYLKDVSDQVNLLLSASPDDVESILLLKNH